MGGRREWWLCIQKWIDYDPLCVVSMLCILCWYTQWFVLLHVYNLHWLTGHSAQGRRRKFLSLILSASLNITYTFTSRWSVNSIVYTIDTFRHSLIVFVLYYNWVKVYHVRLFKIMFYYLSIFNLRNVVRFVVKETRFYHQL